MHSTTNGITTTIIYGASDDLIELSGHYAEEIGRFGGTDIIVTTTEHGDITISARYDVRWPIGRIGAAPSVAVTT